MKRFSVIIPAYDNERYLPACLDSLLAQSFTDWEAVVVIDGSPDRCAVIAQDHAARDGRFVVVDKPHNEGTHRARKSGVARASGEYALFLDSDDEVPAGALGALDERLAQRPCEMLHYGIRVVDAGVNEGERAAFEAYINRPMAPLRGRRIMKVIFDAEGGYEQDWRVTQRVYRTDFLKRAYEAMNAERLGRAQDAYEFFVIASLASEQLTANDVVALDYYYGRGLNGSAALSVESFLKSARAFQMAIDAIEEYAASCHDPSLDGAVRGAKEKLLQLLCNDWHERVADEDKLEAAQGLVPIIGEDETIYELVRFVRDDAYALWAQGAAYEGEEPFDQWFDLARSLARSKVLSPRTYAMAQQARNDRENVRARTVQQAVRKRWDDQRIRLFVAAHKDVDLFESDILQPVQVGAANAAARFDHMLSDDAGENISELNPQYCELTAQYWAWKNVDADYYGFCHYRRYFNFSDVRYEENDYGEIMDGVIDAATQKKYGLDDATIARAVEGYDVITTEMKDLRKFPFRANTPLEQYVEAPLLKEDDLPTVLAIVEDMHPDYVEDVEAFANGNFTCFCNMYVMKKDIFFAYCEWMFPILERFCEVTDMSTYSKEALRTPGHLSERLFNIYYNHQMRTGAQWKTKQVQCVHFEHPDKTHGPALPSMQLEQPLPVVPVVFAADGGYVPMLTTTISSMLENASPERFYDIVVLENGISGYDQQVMKRFLDRANARLRFVGAGSLVAEYDLSTNNEHIGIETYFRFLIQDILPEYHKVLYLDSDLIVEGDVAALYDTDLGDALVGAVRDIDFLGNLNLKDGKRLAYNAETLHMKDPYDYFQAGVLVLNTEAMRNAHGVDEWLTFAADPDYIYNDQDVLNACCEGRVRYLDPRWNVMNDCGNRIANVFVHAPAAVYDGFCASYADPWIIHYAGFQKPWKDWYCDRNEVYWRYARNTPFYEVMLAMLLANERPDVAPAPKPPALPVGRAVRKIVNPLMPVGSKRRETVKGLAHKVMGR